MVNQTQKQFINLLNKIDYSKRLYEVFNDFCTLGTYSLALPFHEEIARQEFEKVAKKYSKDQIKQFDEAFTLMVNDLELEHHDFLGEVYGECELANDRQGQFFTPYHLSLMMAKMTLGDVKSEIEQKGFLMVNEPACGSGGMLIAVRQVLIEAQCNPSRDIFVVAQDVSDIAFMMCYIQLSLYGIAAKVIHGNTITGETWRVLHTPVCFLTDWPLRLTLRRIGSLVEEQTEQRPEAKELPAMQKPGEQMGLF